MPIWLTESRKTRRAGRFAGQATAPMPYRDPIALRLVLACWDRKWRDRGLARYDFGIPFGLKSSDAVAEVA
jgi:hypothetical protein